MGTWTLWERVWIQLRNDPKSRSPDSVVQHSYRVDSGTLQWIYLYPPRGLGHERLRAQKPCLTWALGPNSAILKYLDPPGNLLPSQAKRGLLVTCSALSRITESHFFFEMPLRLHSMLFKLFRNKSYKIGDIYIYTTYPTIIPRRYMDLKPC